MLYLKKLSHLSSIIKSYLLIRQYSVYPDPGWGRPQPTCVTSSGCGGVSLLGQLPSLLQATRAGWPCCPLGLAALLQLATLSLSIPPLSFLSGNDSIFQQLSLWSVDSSILRSTLEDRSFVLAATFPLLPSVPSCESPGGDEGGILYRCFIHSVVHSHCSGEKPSSV